jgi:glycine/D-amino acid oxidase-like deaminating enzyme
VVGLGLVGASATFFAARAGARVLAVDADAPGTGTTSSSFAWLNANRKEPDAYHRLNAAGMAAHRALALELGDAYGHHDGGSLEWVEGDEAQRELRARVGRLAGRGYRAELISRDDALAFEPGLGIAPSVSQVAFYADEAWLDAPRAVRVLLDAASREGAEIRRTAVRSLRREGARAASMQTTEGEVSARSMLVCVGPATQAFLEPLGVAMPVGQVHGLLAVTSPVTERLDRVVHAPGVHFRPDADGGLLLGADDLDGAVVADASPARRAGIAAEMLARAGRVFPAARKVEVSAIRVGVRPMPSDRHTIAGPIPGLGNAWMIATHSGITLGPLLGRLVAEEIVHATPSTLLAPFRPTRFATAPTALSRP